MSKSNSIHAKSWTSYLSTIVRMSEDKRTVNGHPFDNSRTRAYFRWVIEGTDPNFFAVDRWLSFFDLHVNDFFHFCDENRLPAWKGEEPDWHAEITEMLKQSR